VARGRETRRRWPSPLGPGRAACSPPTTASAMRICARWYSNRATGNAPRTRRDWPSPDLRGTRSLLAAARHAGAETALQLEELQQRHEPEPRRAALVRQQTAITVQQRPACDQLLRLPLAPHPHQHRGSGPDRYADPLDPLSPDGSSGLPLIDTTIPSEATLRLGTATQARGLEVSRGEPLLCLSQVDHGADERPVLL
jgi:hypothetical protein